MRFLFETEAWTEAQLCPIVLRRVFRQRDEQFVNLLDEMRRAQLSPFSVALLKHCVNYPPASFLTPATTAQPLPPTCDSMRTDTAAAAADPAPAAPNLFLSTRLFAKNDAADYENQRRLEELRRSEGGAQLHIWLSHDEGNANFVKDCIAPARVSLRLGAQVMLLKNLDQHAKLVNGSRGVVTGFETQLSAERLKKVHMHPAGSPPLVPRVAFQVDPMAGAQGWITRNIYPEEWTVEEGGRTVASRTQVPLKLAWGISIHKSQGMTISSLEVELGSCFEAGQAYVALSRAVSLQQTRIITFDERRVRSNAKVVAFYANIEADNPEQAVDVAPTTPRHDMPRPSGNSSCNAAAVNQPGSQVGDVAKLELSEQQRARIEANKAAALARRRALSVTAAFS